MEKKEDKVKKKKDLKNLDINFPMVLAISFFLAGVFFIYLAITNQKPKPKEVNKDDEGLVEDNPEGFDSIKKDDIFYIEEEVMELTYKDKKVTIEVSFNDGKPKTKINDFEIDNYYATGGYKLDKMFILTSADQSGEKLVFFDSNLNKLDIKENYNYNNLEVNKDGVIKATFLNNQFTFGTNEDYLVINSLEISLCDGDTFKTKISEYKDTIASHYDEIIKGKALLKVNGNKIDVSYINKDTVKKRYSEDLEKDTGLYCAK